MPIFDDDPFGGVKDDRANRAVPSPREVGTFHSESDVDSTVFAHHHTLGLRHQQAAYGDHTHNGRDSKLLAGTAAQYEVAPTSALVVANTTTETVIGSLVIPAGDAQAGSIYSLRLFGFASVVAATTPTFLLQFKLGGVGGTVFGGGLGPTTTASGATSKYWEAECEFILYQIGAGGVITGSPRKMHTLAASGQVGQVHAQAVTSIAIDTTVQNTISCTWTWGTAASGNTCSRRGVIAGKIR